MTWVVDQLYNQLPTLPPRVDLETKAILKACIPARVALADPATKSITLSHRAVEQTAQFTTQKIAAVRALIEDTRVHVNQYLPKIYSYELLTIIFEQPYCRIKNLVDKKIAKRQTASEYLKQLCQIGVLKERQVGKEKLFIHPKLVELMTRDSNEFEAY